MDIPNPYASKDLRLLMAVPVILLVLSLFAVLVFPKVPLGVDLRGGVLVTIQSPGSVDSAALKAAMEKYSKTVDVRSFSTPSGTGIEVELENRPQLEAGEARVNELLTADSDLSAAEVQAAAGQNPERVAQLEDGVRQRAKAVLDALGSSAALPADAHEASKLAQAEFSTARQSFRDAVLADARRIAPDGAFSFREVGSSLSKFFLSRTENVVLYAFILAAIIIFIVFRSLVPALTVIFGAVADIVMTMAGMALLGIPLTLASIATLLMLIGFSLDTDVMLSMRVLKRKEGTPEERAFDSMKTGFLMNLTTIGAFGSLWLVSQWLQIATYAQIGSVAVLGAIADFIATWAFNASLILWYANKTAKR